MQTKAIEQLRSQVAFLRVARPDKYETRRMTDAQAFAFNHVHSACGHIEQQIDEVVLEQIDFIDVEKSTVGGGEQSG